MFILQENCFINDLITGNKEFHEKPINEFTINLYIQALNSSFWVFLTGHFFYGRKNCSLTTLKKVKKNMSGKEKIKKDEEKNPIRGDDLTIWGDALTLKADGSKIRADGSII